MINGLNQVADYNFILGEKTKLGGENYLCNQNQS